MVGTTRVSQHNLNCVTELTEAVTEATSLSPGCQRQGQTIPEA